MSTIPPLWTAEDVANIKEKASAIILAEAREWLETGFRHIRVSDGCEPWDLSGTLNEVEIDIPLDEWNEHIDGSRKQVPETIEDWEQEYTGEWTATHMSGMGKSWNTFDSWVHDKIEEIIGEEIQFPEEWQEDEELYAEYLDMLGNVHYEIGQMKIISLFTAYAMHMRQITKNMETLKAKENKNG